MFQGFADVVVAGGEHCLFASPLKRKRHGRAALVASFKTINARLSSRVEESYPRPHGRDVSFANGNRWGHP